MGDLTTHGKQTKQQLHAKPSGFCTLLWTFCICLWFSVLYVCVCFISCVFARLTSARLRWKTESHCARLGRTTKVTIPGVYIKAKWWDTRIYASNDFLKIKMFVRWSTQPSCPQWQDCSNRCSTALRNNVFLYCCAVINDFHYFIYKLSKHTIKYQ